MKIYTILLIYNFSLSVSLHSTQKIKHLQQVLDICINSKLLFEYALSNWNSSADSTATPSVGNANSNSSGAGGGGGGTIASGNNDAEFQKHILLFESRLQNCLKTLIKLWLSAKDPKQKADLYKKMYMETLNIRKVTGTQHEQTSVTVLAQQFAILLERLTQLERIHANNLNNNNSSNNGTNNAN